MDFIHAREYLEQGDVVVVNCSHQCNIRLTDDSNFEIFRRGRTHQYYGGAYTHFPAHIPVPHDGHWNVTIDLAGRQATIRHSIQYLKANAA